MGTSVLKVSHHSGTCEHGGGVEKACDLGTALRKRRPKAVGCSQPDPTNHRGRAPPQGPLQKVRTLPGHSWIPPRKHQALDHTRRRTRGSTPASCSACPVSSSRVTPAMPSLVCSVPHYRKSSSAADHIHLPLHVPRASGRGRHTARTRQTRAQ